MLPPLDAGMGVAEGMEGREGGREGDKENDGEWPTEYLKSEPTE